jgi:hypothetical protein
MSENYHKLEKMLLQKDFEELSTEQQSWVEGIMTIPEYTAERKTLLGSKEILKERGPVPSGNLSSLQEKLKAKHQFSYGELLLRPIVLYKSVLLAATVGMIVWFLRPEKTRIEIRTEIKEVLVTITDTITKEKIIYKDRIRYKTKTITVPVAKTDTIYMPFANQEIFYQEKENRTINKKQSKTMKEMEGLLDFIVSIN